MLPSVIDHARETIQQLFTFILAQGHTDYLGERVSQLEHSLQCAHLAHQSEAHGSDPEVVLGALLHDVGRFIPDAKDMPAMIAPDGAFIGRASHEVLGERYLRQLGFGEKVCQLVGAHVMAKRYLTAVEEEYYNGLSETSKRTLRYQGGVFTQEQIDEARKDPWLEAKLAVRRWDDQAKVPDMKVPELQAYEDMAVEYLAESRSRIWIDSRSYKIPEKPVLVISIPEQSLKDALQSEEVLKLKESEGWIMQSVSSEHGLLIDQCVFDQLIRRGVRVAAVSSTKNDYNSTCSDGILRCSVEDTQANGHTWLGLPLPSPDAISRVRFVIQAGLKLLKDNSADFVCLYISDILPCASLANELARMQGLGLEATIVVTASNSHIQVDGNSRQTILDLVLS